MHVMILALGSQNYKAETTLTVLPSQAPKNLKATPDSLRFNFQDESLPLYITWTYGGSKIDITAPEAKTTYATQSGNSDVVAVSAAGVVTAKASGQDTVIASNSGKSVSIPVTVNITNHAPVIAVQGGTTLTVAPPHVKTLNVRARDVEGNAVALSLLDAPAFASFTDLGGGKGQLVLTPLPADVGQQYEFRVYALDDGSPALAAVRTINVKVPFPKPTLAFSANPSTVAKQGISTLRWFTTNATACTASGAWTGGRPTAGSVKTSKLAASKTYRLTCTGAGESVAKSVRVTVN